MLLGHHTRGKDKKQDHHHASPWEAARLRAEMAISAAEEHQDNDSDDDLMEEEIQTHHVEKKVESSESSDDADEESIASSNLSASNLRGMPMLRLAKKWKRLLLVWHLIMLFVSLTIIAVAIFLEFFLRHRIIDQVKESNYFNVIKNFIQYNEPKPQLDHFLSLIYTYAFAFHVYGWSFLFATIAYNSFFYHGFTFTWPLVALISMVTLILETSNIMVRLTSDNQISKDFQRSLKEMLLAYQVHSKKAVNLEYDYISAWGKCCGVSSEYDFQKHFLMYQLEAPTGRHQEVYNLQVPPTCCNWSEIDATVQGVIECATKSTNIYKRPCFTVFYDILMPYKQFYLLSLMLMLSDVFIHTHIYYTMMKRQGKRLKYRALFDLDLKRQIKWENITSYTRGDDTDSDRSEASV